MATVKEWVREYWYLGLVAAVVGVFLLWQARQPLLHQWRSRWGQASAA